MRKSSEIVKEVKDWVESTYGSEILSQAIVVAPILDLAFLRSAPSRKPEQSGILPAIVGTLYICLICAGSAIPIGVGTAILLEEFKPKHPLLRRFHGFIQTNITNLAGVPSIVYGILGLTAFANNSLFHSTA